MTRPALARRTPARCALALVACGDGLGATAPRAPPAAPAATDLAAIKDYLLEHTERLVADTGAIAPGTPRTTTRSPRPRTSTTRACSRRIATRCAASWRGAGAGSPRPTRATRRWRASWPGCRRLRRVRRDHRRGRRRQRPGERRSVRPRDPAGRTLKQPGNFNYLIETSAFGTEPGVPGQGRGARPRRRRQGGVRRVAARRRLLRRRRTRLRAVREGARRGGARVGAHSGRRAHRARGHDAHDVRVLRRLEELALHRRRARRARTRSWRRRASRTSPTSSAASCWSTTTSSRWWPRPTPQQAKQTKQSLAELHDFAADLRDEGGRPGASSPPRRRTRSAPGPRSAPRRSPARSPRPPRSSNIEIEEG